MVSTTKAAVLEPGLESAMPVRQGVVLIDGHVHFHDPYSQADFFAAARRNFTSGARHAGEPTISAGCLLMTESAGTDYFASWASQARESGFAPFALTAEDSSLAVPPSKSMDARRDAGASGCVAGGPLTKEQMAAAIYGVTGENDIQLYVLAGRQIVCAEDLEVLALLTAHQFPERRPIRETIRSVREAGALVVLPWGFGKWSGARGRLMREIIETVRPEGVFLGDNGGRLAGGRRPALFELGASLNWKIVPGSDPLPMRPQQSRAGSYGCILRGDFDPDRPAASVRAMFMALTKSPRTFGRLENIGGFVRSQIAMQWRKRFSRGSRASAKTR